MQRAKAKCAAQSLPERRAKHRGPIDPVPPTAIIAPDAWATFQFRLRTYVRRRVDPAMADDVVGDIMLRLVRHEGALAAAENPTAWMLRVAANAISDHHRRREVERRALARLATEGASAPVEESDTSASTEIANCLVPLIRGLPAAYGQALLLTDIEGLTQAEAAPRLGLSVSGVKSRVQRGRAKLKQALLRCCVIEVDRRGRVRTYQPRGSGCRKRC